MYGRSAFIRFSFWSPRETEHPCPVFWFGFLAHVSSCAPVSIKATARFCLLLTLDFLPESQSAKSHFLSFFLFPGQLILFS
jgi:hypothetical protein